MKKVIFYNHSISNYTEGCKLIKKKRARRHILSLNRNKDGLFRKHTL